MKVVPIISLFPCWLSAPQRPFNSSQNLLLVWLCACTRAYLTQRMLNKYLTHWLINECGQQTYHLQDVAPESLPVELLWQEIKSLHKCCWGMLFPGATGTNWPKAMAPSAWTVHPWPEDNGFRLKRLWIFQWEIQSKTSIEKRLYVCKLPMRIAMFVLSHNCWLNPYIKTN